MQKTNVEWGSRSKICIICGKSQLSFIVLWHLLVVNLCPSCSEIWVSKNTQNCATMWNRQKNVDFSKSKEFHLEIQASLLFHHTGRGKAYGILTMFGQEVVSFWVFWRFLNSSGIQNSVLDLGQYACVIPSSSWPKWSLNFSLNQIVTEKMYCFTKVSKEYV